MKMNTTKKFAVVVVTILLVLGGCFGCHKDERDALLQLKSAINDYPNATALPNWKEEEATGRPSDCCNWNEVLCDGESGRVMYLLLAFVRRAEEEWHVNASLFLPFRHLRILDLSGNSITDVEAFQNLRTLDLSRNSVDGFKRIHGGPRNNNASKLEYLYLENIASQDAYMLLDSLLSFPSLMSLDLSGNNFKGVLETTDSLSKFKKIQYLSIAGNDLYEVPLCLRNLTSLQHLNLHRNNLHGQLPNFLTNLTALQYLDLSSNQLGGNLANSPLTKLTSIRYLSLSNNRFQIPQTFKPFSNHSNLDSLSLNGNSVIVDYANNRPFIPKFQLSYFSLSNCNISATLPGFILHQHNLKYLDLSHNYIHGSFPAWIIENNTFLYTLILANNLLIGSAHMSRCHHSQIKFIDVSYNNINGISANLSQSLPNIWYLNFSRNSINQLTPWTFGYMKNLSWLDLSYNSLSGALPSGWIKTCFSLNALFLSHNTLEVIPSFSTSFSLRFLLINNNNISGTIPSGLFPKSLELLDLSSNHLEGQIPAEICKLYHLISIDLSHNSFSGILPPCFNSPHLLYVYLYKNKLNGPLLTIFKNNTSLIILDLEDNHLSGMIPNWIDDLRNLSVLSLQNNHFEGHIPAQVCHLDKLTILDLSGNNIDGQIPRCLGQMSFQPLETKSSFQEQDVEFLNPLDDLKLFKILPPEFLKGMFGDYLTFKNEMEITTKSHTYNYEGTDLDAMTSINLAWNKLSGEIPQELGGMAGVRALNLSHNGLMDAIPSSLSKLSQLESLDLSYNNLNGSIPPELINLNALAVFSVAHNNLSGRTPKQKAQFGTFEESSYEDNPFLCGPPLLNACSASSQSPSRNQSVDGVDDSMDMDVFYICFTFSYVMMFFGTLIVLWINPHWRRVWFYYGEMWITWAHYLVVDNMWKAWNVFMVGLG